MANDKQNKLGKISSAWTLCVNPLRGLTKSQIDQMLQNARIGNDVRLQIAFKEIERNMPIFGICIEKRLAGIINRNWKITPDDDTPEANKQAIAVQKIFDKCDRRNIDGLTMALRHLGMASFRGRSVIKPFFHNGDLVLKCLENWNVLERNNRLYWNPDCSYDIDFNAAGFDELPDNEVCWIKNDLAIDIPGIQIYLRQLVGEEQWARAVEKYGIAQILITAPEGTSDSALPVWTERAARIFEGGSGVLPNGADVHSMTDARGQDPFSAYIQHQMEMIAILAVGGALNTIGGATGLGSNLAEQQNSQFQSLINQDCKKIANALTDCVVRKCVQQLFGKNAECHCRFTFTEDDEFSATEYIDIAKKLMDMNVPLDISKLKQLTKLDFIKDVEEWSPAEPKTDEDKWQPE